jgi:hypothetical protein
MFQFIGSVPVVASMTGLFSYSTQVSPPSVLYTMLCVSV